MVPTQTPNDSYSTAVAALYSGLHQAKTPEAIREAAKRRKTTVEDMREYMTRASISFDGQGPSLGKTSGGPAIVHITGTKGKGSTAAMCEAILRSRYRKVTGLFTSPHLVDIRERIRINGKPVPKDVFGQAYWTIRRSLEEAAKRTNPDTNTENNDTGDTAVDPSLPILPGYFRMLTLMALFIFSRFTPEIDVVILEVGMGGRYDATNVFDLDKHNIVCGVTLLDLDHTRVLGETLEEIAWEKGGIFQTKKVGGARTAERPTGSSLETDQTEDSMTTTPVANKHHDTIIQDPLSTNVATLAPQSTPAARLFAIESNTDSVLNVLRQCAAIEAGERLEVVSTTIRPGFRLGLQGDHQRLNAELAIRLCEAVMVDSPTNDGVTAMMDGLGSAVWPGRCQTVPYSDKVTLCLDGAHTPKSVEACLKWFVQSTSSNTKEKRVLLFNCSKERDPVCLLQILKAGNFDKVYFSPADFERPSAVQKSSAAVLLAKAGVIPSTTASTQGDETPGPIVESTWQDTLAKIWEGIDGETQSGATAKANIKVRDVLDTIRKETQQMDGTESGCRVLVVGSLYLVGSVLSAIGWTEDDSGGRLVMDD